MRFLKLTYEPYTLQFKFDAGTSRGIMRERKVWFLKLHDAENPAIVGTGEVAPLAGLSLDDRPDMELVLQKLCQKVAGKAFDEAKPYKWLYQLVPATLPAVRFGLETAMLDFQQGGKGIIFQTRFTEGKQRILVNGLIWMGTPDFMQVQIEDKLQKGFQCLKLKIGSLDFEQELAILKEVRKRYTVEEITLRVDANGAFLPANALEKLKRLADLDIHSIEQPIRAGQIEDMARLCALSPLPIALDEELIPVIKPVEKRKLLEAIKPAYIILKPSLLGGFVSCNQWIIAAEKEGVDWWVTSALESNIGLNAICQYTAEWVRLKNKTDFPQGLGTGALYHNNIASNLEMEGQEIFIHL